MYDRNHAARRRPTNVKNFSVLEAPSVFGLRPTGVERLPEVLIREGLLRRLQARHAGRILPRTAYRWDRDSPSGILNGPEIADYSGLLADAVGDALDRGEFPIVLGGDCSIVLGVALALKRRGRSGLLFVDGHADFYNPEANPNGEVASMDLALVTGRGSDGLANLEQRGPLVSDEDVVVFGYRDGDEQRAYGSQPLPAQMRSFDLAAIRSRGINAAADDAVTHFTKDGGCRGFWIHLDADVLDDAIMPAVDYRLPDGLSWHELGTLIRSAVQSRRALGLDITIYNPALDRDGAAGRRLVDTIVDAVMTP